jgi:hypothetical protein
MKKAPMHDLPQAIVHWCFLADPSADTYFLLGTTLGADIMGFVFP